MHRDLNSGCTSYISGHVTGYPVGGILYHLSRELGAPIIRLFFRAWVRGRRNLPLRGPAILASNHLSFLDHLILPIATHRQVVFISKIQHFERPIRRMMFKSWGVIPLQRGTGDSGAYEKSLEIIDQGRLYCIYPEGTRSLDGDLHRGHTGVARLAIETGAPVIPVAMMGTFEALPKGGKLRYQKCGVVIGTPLDFSKHRGKQNDRGLCREVTDEIMQAIAKCSGQKYVDSYQKNPEYRTAEDHEHPRGAGEDE